MTAARHNSIVNSEGIAEQIKCASSERAEAEMRRRLWLRWYGCEEAPSGSHRSSQLYQDAETTRKRKMLSLVLDLSDGY